MTDNNELKRYDINWDCDNDDFYEDSEGQIVLWIPELQKAWDFWQERKDSTTTEKCKNCGGELFPINYHRTKKHNGMFACKTAGCNGISKDSSKEDK